MEPGLQETVSKAITSEADLETEIMGTYACRLRDMKISRELAEVVYSGKVHLTWGCLKLLTLSELVLEIIRRR